METTGLKTAAPPDRLRGLHPAWIKRLAPYLSALAGAFFLISIFGHQQVRAEALRLRLGLEPALAGYTAVEIPPLATIRARTHATPLLLSVRLEGIDPYLVQKMLEKNRGRAELINSVTGSLRAAAVHLTLKILFLSAAGGALGVFLWRRRPGPAHLLGALGATLVVGLLLAGTYLSYSPEKFKNPEFDGALKVAPWALSLADQALDKIDTLSNKMGLLADNIHQLFSQIDRLQPFGEDRKGLVKVLHVSDIHNNPAALVYVQRVAGLFGVDLIIDTGDITDYGTPLEGLLLERLAGIGVPYVFIPGNHDSPETIRKMQSIPGVAVLSGSTVAVKNIRIAGFADPSSGSNGIEPPALNMISRYAGEIEESLSRQAIKPDILAVHNHRIARQLAGKAPVILHGHDHKLSVEETGGSIFIDPGSTGGAGLRRLQGDRTPYTLVIQYYSPEGEKMKLLAADSITLKNLGSGFHVDRQVFDQ